MHIKSILFICIFITFPSLLLADHININKKKLPAPLFNNLGSHHRPIATKIPLAQRYFNQGLVLFYSFEYGESIRSFQAAVQIDPHCAMCYWGLALALGSKTDAPLNGYELEDAKTAIKSAADLVNPSNLSERSYIAALTRRYIRVPSERLTEISGLCSSYSQVNSTAKNYADEMHKIIQLFPKDTDAKALYAAALFDVIKWDFWNHHNAKPKPYTLEIINTLESALSLNINHPGANHLYVHIIEFSPYPKRALTSAIHLSNLVPGSEHLAHMPCHTYFSLGRYHEAVIANQQAIAIYKNYVSSCKIQGFKPEMQYLYFHNYDYLITAASMTGQSKLAISTAKEFYRLSIPLIHKNSFLQKWQTSYILTLARFGEWKKILKIPKPESKYQYSLGIWHYAQSLAEIQLNQLEAAKSNLAKLKLIIKRGPIDKNLGNMGYHLLQIGENILSGLIANQSGNPELMFKRFNQAVQIQDTIYNSDPPAWYFPVRQLLGNALLNSNHFKEAKKIFQQDLKDHPKNGWSLLGLAKSLRKLGQYKKADQIDITFKEAWRYSDIITPIFPIFNSK